MFDPSEITSEQSFWEIWKTARRVRPSSFNRRCICCAAVILLIYVVFTSQHPDQMAEMIRTWAAIGLDFSGTILGFLIAGFTIFATLSRPALLEAMARTNEPVSKLSYLKYNFFVFFQTFGWYVGFAAYCIVVLILGAAAGPVSQLLRLLDDTSRLIVANVLCRSCALLLAVWLIILCLELKSFVYNLYHVVMTSIRWMVEFETDSKEATPAAVESTPRLSKAVSAADES